MFYIQNSLNVDVNESEYNRNHMVGPKIKKNRKTFLQIIIKFKGFVPRTKVYRARKHKSDISIHKNLAKRRYVLLKDAYSKAKDWASVDFACADINCSLCLRVKNGDCKFPNFLEKIERLLLQIP